MAVLKQTSPTAWPTAPKPTPSSTVPPASTNTAVGRGSDQPPASCLPFMRRLHSPGRQRRQKKPAAASRIHNHPGERSTRPPVLRDEINEAVKTAMKSQDKLKLGTLRMVNSAIKIADIEARGAGKAALGDADILGLLQKLIKQRQESVELYRKGGRQELVEQEEAEIAVIRHFLPQALSEADTNAAITEVIRETGASGMKDMGKVIAALKERYAGRMDFAKASGLVKARLTG